MQLSPLYSNGKGQTLLIITEFWKKKNRDEEHWAHGIHNQHHVMRTKMQGQHKLGRDGIDPAEKLRLLYLLLTSVHCNQAWERKL